MCLLNGDLKKNLNTRERFGRCWETDSPGRRNVNPLTGPGTPEQHCLLFLPAGVLDGQAASAQAHLGGGCVGSRGGRVAWSRPGEGGLQGTWIERRGSGQPRGSPALRRVWKALLGACPCRAQEPVVPGEGLLLQFPVAALGGSSRVGQRPEKEVQLVLPAQGSPGQPDSPSLRALWFPAVPAAKRLDKPPAPWAPTEAGGGGQTWEEGGKLRPAGEV